MLSSSEGRPGVLESEIDVAGLTYQVGADLPWLDQVEGDFPAPEAVLLDLASLDSGQARQAVDQCRKLKLPVLAVLPRERVDTYDPALNPDDFLLSPMHRGELTARLRQASHRVRGPAGAKVLKLGDLSIDLERYDVTIGGRRVSLTYKEFQLLVLLASNPGRVYTREALLSQVWGYDYLGGTRTVDVHIRRLRSKVEDPDHSFVETIWNVGYRFKAQSPSN
ncbi:MAG: response regulator transcription factor [SAR202 cluster bacterium]|nr:response regulator transcription factor [SAR202 cluster bacterium]